MKKSDPIKEIARLKVGIIIKRMEFVAELLKPCATVESPGMVHDKNGVGCMAGQLLQCITDMDEVFGTDTGKNSIAGEGLNIANL